MKKRSSSLFVQRASQKKKMLEFRQTERMIHCCLGRFESNILGRSKVRNMRQSFLPLDVSKKGSGLSGPGLGHYRRYQRLGICGPNLAEVWSGGFIACVDEQTMCSSRRLIETGWNQTKDPAEVKRSLERLGWLMCQLDGVCLLWNIGWRLISEI